MRKPNSSSLAGVPYFVTAGPRRPRGDDAGASPSRSARVRDNSGAVVDKGSQSPKRKRGVRSTARTHGHGRTSPPWHTAPNADGPPKSSRTRSATRSIACAALLLGGCTLTAPLDPTADAPLPARDPEFVTIYVRNDTSREAVNVDFHASVAAIGPDVGTELFQDANRLAGLVGIAGSGLLQPGQADIVRWSCEDGVAVGTLGGTFLDANTGESLGTGQRRWAQAGAQFTCGDLIVISFGATNDGYRTDMNIE